MATLPQSRWADLDGPVHYVDYGGPDDGPLLVCVHGLGGSHASWAAVAPGLTRACRMVALDLAGFGLTRGGTRSTSVRANRQLLHRFLIEVAGTPAVLVGNSMGGLIASWEAAQHPEAVAGTVLIDPALPPTARPDPVTLAMFTGFFLPGIGPAMLSGRARLRTPEQLALATLQLCCVDLTRVPAEVLEAHGALARIRGGHPQLQREFLVAARSLLRELGHRFRHAAMLRRISCPVLLLHGEKDRLVPVAAARRTARANPGWHFEIAPNTGHVPQLEAPEWTVGHILGWLAREDIPAAGAVQATSP